MKLKFLIVSICIAVSFFIFTPSFCLAEEKKENKSTVTTFFETGEKFTEVFGYEEADIADDISYRRYSVSLNQKATPSLAYTLDQLIETRNYDNNDSLDNYFTKTTASVVYNVPKSESFILPQELRTSYMYKLKNYVHTVSGAANDDYNQHKFSIGVSYIGDQKNWRIDYDTGINSFNYDHISSKDEDKYFNQIQFKKKLLDKKLEIFAGYKIQYAHRKTGDDRTEPEEVFGFDFKPGLRNLSLVSLKFENGKSETREEDVREDEYDFKYDRLTTKIDIPITSRLKNSFVHKLIHRKYTDWNKSWHKLRMDNTTRFTHIDDTIKALYYDLVLEYLETDYIVYDFSDSKQIAEGLIVTYEKKKNWKVKSGLTFRRKEYSSLPSVDSKRWVYILSLEKTFSPDLSFAFDFRKEWRDYYQGPGDRTYDVFKISLNYKF